jgi:hypothetical protein
MKEMNILLNTLIVIVLIGTTPWFGQIVTNATDSFRSVEEIFITVEISVNNINFRFNQGLYDLFPVCCSAPISCSCTNKHKWTAVLSALLALHVI